MHGWRLKYVIHPAYDSNRHFGHLSTTAATTTTTATTAITSSTTAVTTTTAARKIIVSRSFVATDQHTAGLISSYK